MSAAVKPRAGRRAGHHVRRYKGCLLTRVGRQTVVVAMQPRGPLSSAAGALVQARIS
jgi:hypothetical protein